MAERTALYTDQLNNVSVVYNIYRIVLPLVLLVTYITSPANTQLGALAPTLFVQVTTAYAVFGVAITFFSPASLRLLENTNLLASTLVIDIVAMTLIIYTSGGTTSGLGLLLIVTVASGSILIRGRISTFLAAIAALALIYTELYLSLSLDAPPNRFVETGILGTILFATSLYVQTVTDRIYKAALLADKQAGAIIDLEKLNNEIIQSNRESFASDRDNYLKLMQDGFKVISDKLKENHLAIIYFKDSKLTNVFDFLRVLQNAQLEYLTQVHVSKPKFTYKQNTSQKSTVEGDSLYVFRKNSSLSEVLPTNESLGKIEVVILQLVDEYLAEHGSSTASKILDNSVIPGLWRSQLLPLITDETVFQKLMNDNYEIDSETRKVIGRL